MTITCVSTQRRQPKEAAAHLAEQLREIQAELLVVFASSAYAPEALCQGLAQHFPKVQMLGCSTAGEIISGQMLQQSVVVMALTQETLKDVKIEVVEHLSQGVDPGPALARFSNHFQQPIEELNNQHYVGLILIDGLSMAEEELMEKLGDKSNLAFIGASAGDDLQFQCTHVYANGKAYTDAAVLAILEPRKGFEIVKTQSFQATEAVLTATRVEESTRTVYEFDGKPATQAYAQALGVPEADLAEYFMSHPLGLMDRGEPFVRSPQRVVDRAVVFYCQVKEDMPLAVLQPRDIVEDTRKALAQPKDALDSMAGMIDFHCILRFLQLQKEDQTEHYGKLSTEIPTVGFCTYGEEFITHMNQTSTFLIFK